MQSELIELSGVVYAPDFTKKKAEQTGLNLVSKVFEEGNDSPLEVYSNIVRLKAVIDSADKAFRERLNLSNASLNAMANSVGLKCLLSTESPI